MTKSGSMTEKYASHLKSFFQHNEFLPGLSGVRHGFERIGSYTSEAPIVEVS